MTGPVTPAERANELPPDDPLAAVRDVARLAALWRLALLDTPAEEAFDRLTRLTTRLLDVPVALVSLVDADRQFFKSGLGLPEPWASRRETPLSYSFCQHAVARRRPLAIADARVDPLVQDSPAIAELGVIAYLGVPLITPRFAALEFRVGDELIGEAPPTGSCQSAQAALGTAANAASVPSMKSRLSILPLSFELDADPNIGPAPLSSAC